MNTYSVPDQYFFPIHHIRSRFIGDAENVLIYMASEVAKLPTLDKELFSAELCKAIRAYPGNADRDDKTIDNWRTEISSLFGFVVPDSVNGTCSPGQMAVLLAEHQDLIQFFRYFLLRFQYPGAHVKPQAAQDMVGHGVKFKPAKFPDNTLLVTSSAYSSRTAIATLFLFSSYILSY